MDGGKEIRACTSCCLRDIKAMETVKQSSTNQNGCKCLREALTIQLVIVDTTGAPVLCIVGQQYSFTRTIKLRGTQRQFPPKCIENTFQAIQSTFRCLEMHSKRQYKICICSVILGQLESFRNCKGFGIIFPKILGAILSFTKMIIFLILLSVAFSIPKILGFHFLRKIA